MPLPTVISTTGKVSRGGFGGPFKASSGAVYMVLNDAAPTAFKATDPVDGTWARVGPWDTATTTVGLGVFQVGDVLHVAATEANGTLRYATFDMAADTWSASTLLHTLSNNTSAGEAFCSIVVRSNGDIVIVYRGADHTAMGTTYIRVAHARRIAGTWTTGVSVDGGGTTTVSYTSARAVLGTSDRVHFYYKNHSNARALARTLQPDDTLSAIITVDSVVSGGSDIYTARAITYDDAGVRRIRVGVRDSGDRLSWARNRENATTGAIENEIADPSVVADITANTVYEAGWNLGASVVRYGGEFHLHYIGAADQDLWHDKTTTGAWGTDSNILAGTFTDVTSHVYTRGGNDVIGYIYTDGTSTWYNETVLAAAVVDPPVAQALTGTVAGAATTSGGIAARVAANGTAAGASTTSGTAVALVVLSGSVAGVGGASGTISTEAAATPQALTGTIAGTSTANGTATAPVALSGTAAGAASTSSSIAARAAASGTVAGTSTTSGTLAARAALSATIAGAGAASGNISTGTAPTPQALTGTAAGTATTSGSIAARAGLSGTAAGTAATSATATARVALTGTAAGSGASTGTHALHVALTATAAGSGTISGGLTTGTLQPLSGAVAGTSSTAGALNAVVDLSATGAGAGAGAGVVTLYTFVYLSGTATGVGALLGAPVFWLSIIGTAAGAGAATGTITARTAGAVEGRLTPRNRIQSEPDVLVSSKPDGVLRSEPDGAVTSRSAGVLISTRG